MKKLISIVFFVLLIFMTFTGCNTSFPGKTAYGIAAEETYPELPGEPSAIYYSIGDMINDADCIALVEVIDSRIEYTETIPGWPAEPTTYTEINFIEVYKGAEQPGEGTEVVEMGGFQDDHLLGDYPQLMKNGRYVLFMQHTDGGCSICGAFQGRFIVRDGFVIQQRTEDVGLKDYTPVSLDEFKKLVEAD